MISYNAYLLEDDAVYDELDSLVYKENKYVLLSQRDNVSNICIRKLENDMPIRLEPFEYDKILNKFIEKNKNLFD